MTVAEVAPAKVAVLIPCYNEEPRSAACVRDIARALPQA
jgi:glycosyltransferase involved in cell wall biosynthesis